MPIRTKVEDDLVCFTVTGAVDANEILAVLDDHFARHGTRLVAWDLTAAMLATFEASSFRTVARRAAAHVAKRGEHPKTALLAGSEGDRLLLKAFAARAASESDLPIHVFLDRSKMLRWLRAD